MNSQCLLGCNNLAYTISPGSHLGILNPDAYKRATGFCETKNKTYTSQDARLFDSPRAIQTYIDTPPYDGSVWMDNVYDPRKVPAIYNAGGYTSYNEIIPGQIMYYIDPDVSAPFRHQIYNQGAATTVQLVQTPMGKIEPRFDRVELQGTLNNTSPYSFTRDQLEFRNDIIARQQRKHNQTRYESIR